MINKIPTIIALEKDKAEIRKLALTRYEGGKWRATYLVDDIGDIEEWTDDGIIMEEVPVADGNSLDEALTNLNKFFEKVG